MASLHPDKGTETGRHPVEQEAKRDQGVSTGRRKGRKKKRISPERAEKELRGHHYFG